MNKTNTRQKKAWTRKLAQENTKLKWENRNIVRNSYHMIASIVKQYGTDGKIVLDHISTDDNVIITNEDGKFIFTLTKQI